MVQTSNSFKGYSKEFIEQQEKEQLDKFTKSNSTDDYGQLGFIRGRIFERERLIEELRKIIERHKAEGYGYGLGLCYFVIVEDIEKELNSLEKNGKTN